MTSAIPVLEINDLHAEVNGHAILRGVNLVVNGGEVHAIMGPNGSGKSTLAQVLAGHEAYTITRGDIKIMGESVLGKSAEERSLLGLFLAFQYPVEIPGVNNLYFLKAALNAHRKARGDSELDAVEFLDLAKSKMAELKMDERYLQRSVNESFSGGEKKRNEVLQMSVLKPAMAVLDETDSGLDIDALKIVADGVNRLRDSARGMMVITHYHRLLEHIVPDVVHIFFNGQIVESGGLEIAHALEAKGYGWVGETV
jgi:Fe-S cluster assembly ATP-binding protein